MIFKRCMVYNYYMFTVSNDCQIKTRVVKNYVTLGLIVYILHDHLFVVTLQLNLQCSAIGFVQICVIN